MHLRGSVSTDNGWHSLALVLVKRLVNHTAVLELNLAIVVLPREMGKFLALFSPTKTDHCGESVLAPVVLETLASLALERLGVVEFIAALGEVLAGMGTAALLACLGAVQGLDGVDQQVLELKGLDEIGVPDQATVGDRQVSVLWEQ